MTMMVKMADQKQVEYLMEQFRAIDEDQTGLITRDELFKALKSSDLQIDNDQIESIIDEVDYFGNKRINYSEFLMATLDVRSFLNDNKLRAIFNQFDTDASGSITRMNIVTAMNKMGREITQQELDEIMDEHDI